MPPKFVKKLAGKHKSGEDAAPETKKKPQPESAISANWGKSKATDLKLRELEVAQLLPLKKKFTGAGLLTRSARSQMWER